MLIRNLQATDEDELRAFFEQIIQSTQEGIAVFDRNLRYVLFNPYMERLTGLSARDVVGAHPAELFPGFDADPVRLVLECAWRS